MKAGMEPFDVPAYLDFLSPQLLAQLVAQGEPVRGVPGLVVAKGLQSSFPSLLTSEALAFVCTLYLRTRGQLRQVLQQRREDRAFIDAVTADCVQRNSTRPYLSSEYETVIGRKDASGRVVVGPQPQAAPVGTPVSVPPFLAGEQVTLFGPPDSARLCINAMNALHRRLPSEPPIVAELVAASGQVPRWGADGEDSKTPLMQDLLQAAQNLKECFEGTLTLKDEARGKTYALAETGLSRPIKRIAGLALPDGNHLLNGQPLPLHLLDFALHLYHLWQQPEALVFYIPKLENEEEAAYLKELITQAEALIKEQHPSYSLGTIRLFVVFENPRAIFRIAQMAQALAPHFLGGSLGWHDFLASTARLLRNDPSYRIPIKADPNIVIQHIRESHHILVKALAPIGALKIGGMYGILYEDGNAASFEVSMVGYIKDVVTQLRRGLDGFWVAHPDFVRIGIALVQAWRRQQQDPQARDLHDLIAALVPSQTERDPLLAFVNSPDVAGLKESDPLYLRGVLAANIAPHSAPSSDGKSDSLPIPKALTNSHPEEIRYNIFQALQYLADWLSGHGCVALPATLSNAQGQSIFVRIMDDLATTERSRWEVWAELHHGRFSLAQFSQILAEELAFVRADQRTQTRRVQVKWQGEPARWYPIAARLLYQLMTDENPVEFATELLLPFTLPPVRQAADPWAAAQALCPGRYRSPAWLDAI